MASGTPHRNGKAARSSPPKPPKKKASLLWTIIRFALIITTIVIVTVSSLLYLNCQDKDAWIPKSKQFCEDAKWSWRNMKIRSSFFANLNTALTGFFTSLTTNFGPSVQKYAEKLFDAVKEWFFDVWKRTVALGEKLQSILAEYMGDLSPKFANFKAAMTEYFEKFVAALKDAFAFVAHKVQETWEKFVPQKAAPTTTQAPKAAGKAH